jgi:hypothetical protein
MNDILKQLPEFSEENMFPFYTSGMTTREEIKKYLVTWIRKGHRPETIYTKNNEVYELIGSFRRAGWSHGIFVNKSLDHFLFIIEEFGDFTVLAEGNTIENVIDNTVDFYDNGWNKRKN